jgi:hypothetical protein
MFAVALAHKAGVPKCAMQIVTAAGDGLQLKVAKQLGRWKRGRVNAVVALGSRGWLVQADSPQQGYQHRQGEGAWMSARHGPGHCAQRKEL